jgi:predicted nucleic acid-binding protein
MGMSWVETRDFLSMVCGLLKVEPVTIEMHQAGIDLAERYGLSVYDAMIASAALLTECDTLFTEECDTLFTEDLQDGLLVSGRLRVVNPF